ncbi:MAG: hypothetical protein LBI73_02060 [Myroides sp.]|jgi:hypothetical protein|nr:hypothetical protein [Myroides sp.]
MKVAIKVIIYIFIISILYIGVSIAVSKNQKFVIYFFVKNDNISIAKENYIFVKEIDSLVIDDKQWIIFQSKFCFYKSYGFLELFKHKVCPEELSWVKIELLEENNHDNRRNYYVSYNKMKKTSLFNDYNGCISKEGEVLIIDIYDSEEKLIKSRSFLVKGK